MTGAKRDLAVDGGQPVRSKPWLPNITTGAEERRAVCEVLDSGHLSLFEGCHTPDPPFSFWGGPRVQQLERAWCEYYGAKYAVSVNSATSGLYAAIGALELGYGDEVIVSPYTMSAAATCALIYGAIPIFADVDATTGCLDSASIGDRITERTRAIVVVHQFGIAAEMDSIMELARRHGVKVVEDCAQAHDARYRGRAVGTIGDIGVFSLNVNKTIQAGEGGICLTDDADLRYRLALIRNHGEAVVGDAGYANITNIVGFNFRPTEIAAAIAVEQLKKLPDFTARRRESVRALSAALARHRFLVTPARCSHAPAGADEDDGCISTYYLYPLRFLPGAGGGDRNAFSKMVNAEGVLFSEGYVRPLYLLPMYQAKRVLKHGYPFAAPENRASRTNYHRGACPVAERLYFEEMLINEHVRPPHTLEDVMDIVRAVDKVAAHLEGRVQEPGDRRDGGPT